MNDSGHCVAVFVTCIRPRRFFFVFVSFHAKLWSALQDNLLSYVSPRSHLTPSVAPHLSHSVCSCRCCGRLTTQEIDLVRTLLVIFLVFCQSTLRASGKQDGANLNRERNLQARLLHPNIVRLQNCFQDTKFVYLVLDYASGGDMYKVS